MRWSATCIPAHLRGRGRVDEPVRVWVAGCATGEEAYSVAMLLREHAEPLAGGRRLPGVRHRHRRARHRDGARAACIPAPSSPTSRRRGCASSSPRKASSYRVVKTRAREGAVRRAQPAARPAVLAARPGLLPQPADLPGAPRRRPACWRCSTSRCSRAATCSWASSESADAASSTFAPVDKKHRIYRSRRASAAHAQAARAASPGASRARRRSSPATHRRRAPAADATPTSTSASLEQLLPPSVLIDAQRQHPAPVRRRGPLPGGSAAASRRTTCSSNVRRRPAAGTAHRAVQGRADARRPSRSRGVAALERGGSRAAST